jgi:hypothetical protein
MNKFQFSSFIFSSVIAEDCTEEAISCVSKLYSALEVEGGIGKNIQNTKLRAQVLKTLYKFVESSNEMLLLQIARIILAVSISFIPTNQLYVTVCFVHLRQAGCYVATLVLSVSS